MNQNFRPTVAVVNLERIAENFRILKNAAAKDAFVCPMVKANAYGHGDVAVARKLRAAGATHLGVALIEEALRLRENGDQGEILHFGMFDAPGAEVMIRNKITAVVSSFPAFESLLERVESLGIERPVDFHLKVNTGMNRMGLPMNEVAPFAKRAARIATGAKKRLHFAGLSTHFAEGEDFGVKGGRSERQLLKFREAEKEFRSNGFGDFKLHVANSSASAALEAMKAERAKNGAASSAADFGYADLGIRPGLSLYGIEPETKSGRPLGVQPALEFRSRIVHIQNLKVGQTPEEMERVSYGGRWTATRPSRIGVVPCGYADGYRRGLSKPPGETFVIVGGRLVPVVGTICMDYFMCDLTEVGDAGLNDVVTMLGATGAVSVSAGDLAARVQTIPYEILTGISDRVPRVYVDGTPEVV